MKSPSKLIPLQIKEKKKEKKEEYLIENFGSLCGVVLLVSVMLNWFTAIANI